MRNTVRVLVVDGDVGNQAEVQELLVRHRRFIVIGGTEGEEETGTLVRAFRPDLLLVNADDPQNLRGLVKSNAETLRGTPVIAYSSQPHAHPLKQVAGLWIAQQVAIPISASDLLTAIESALGGPQESSQAPNPTAKPSERAPLAPPAAPSQELTEAAALQTVEGKAPLMIRLAELVSDWTRTPSSSAQEAFLSALAENVCAPAFGGFGREAVRKGLKTLASRFGGPFIAVLAERSRRPVLEVLVRQDDGSWSSSGHFVVGFGEGGTVTYLDYHSDEPKEHAAPEPPDVIASEIQNASVRGGDGLSTTGDFT